MKKKKEPSSFSTFIEVLSFLSSDTHIIPDRYHYNILTGAGCKLKWLKSYLESGKNLCSKTVLRVIEEKHPIAEHESFIDWIKSSYHYCMIYEEAYYNAYGVSFMLDKGLHVSKDRLRAWLEQLLKNNQDLNLFLLLKPDIFNQLKELEDVIFKSKNPQIVSKYIEKNGFDFKNLNLLLEYNDRIVFDRIRDFIKKEPPCKEANDFLTSVIKTKHRDIVMAISSLSVNFEQSVALLKRNDADLLAIYATFNPDFLSDAIVAYIAQVSNDEMFNQLIKSLLLGRGKHLIVSKHVGDRLLKKENRELLLEMIENYHFWHNNFEVDLLSVNDVELSKFYIEKRGISTTEGALLILKSKNDDLIFQMLAQDRSLGYYAEAYLIKNFAYNYIAFYLRGRFLRDFSEAILLKHGCDEIVTEYFNKISYNALTFKAVLQRGDEKFIKRYLLEVPNFCNTSDMLYVFLENANNEQLTDVFKDKVCDEEKITLPYSWATEENNYSEMIFKNAPKANQIFFIENFELSCLDEVALVKSGDADLIDLYVKNNDLCMEALNEFFKMLNKPLILKYIKKHGNQNDIGESELLELLDENLLWEYQNTIGFSDCNVKEILGL